MRSLPLLLCLCALGAVTAADDEASSDGETWRPHEHPAHIVYRIDGTTRVHRSLVLNAETSARVADILLVEGERVPAGDADGDAVVVVLDATLAELALRRAEAAVAEAAAAIPRIEAELAIAQRDTAYERAERERTERLVREGSLGEREGDAQRYRAERAALQEQAVASRLASAEATLASARAQVAEQRERVARHQVRAPAGWTVSERLAEPGALVAPGTGILLLHDARTLEVPLRLTEAEIAALRREQTVTLSFPDHGHEATAHLHRVDVRHDPATRKRLAILHLAGEAAPAASGGLNVVLELAVPREDAAVLVPDRFLDRSGQRTRVQLTDGRLLDVVPLRERDGLVVIDGRALPEGVTLVRPESPR